MQTAFGGTELVRHKNSHYPFGFCPVHLYHFLGADCHGALVWIKLSYVGFSHSLIWFLLLSEKA